VFRSAENPLSFSTRFDSKTLIRMLHAVFA